MRPGRPRTPPRRRWMPRWRRRLPAWVLPTPSPRCRRRATSWPPAQRALPGLRRCGGVPRERCAERAAAASHGVPDEKASLPYSLLSRCICATMRRPLWASSGARAHRIWRTGAAHWTELKHRNEASTRPRFRGELRTNPSDEELCGSQSGWSSAGRAFRRERLAPRSCGAHLETPLLLFLYRRNIWTARARARLAGAAG